MILYKLTMIHQSEDNPTENFEYIIDCPQGDCINTACQLAMNMDILFRLDLLPDYRIAKLSKGNVHHSADQTHHLNKEDIAKGFISIYAEPVSDCTILI